MNKEIDEIDLGILKFMQHNAKSTLEEISEKINLSVSAINKRIFKMERLKVIIRYAAILNKEMLGLRFAGDLRVKLVTNTNADLDRFKEEMAKFNEIISCCHVAGEDDFILKILVRNSDEFNRFYKEGLGTVPNIATINVSVIIEEVKGNIGLNLAGFLKKVP